MGVPSPDEFEAAERRVRARQWLRRARMVSAAGLSFEVPVFLLQDSPEQEACDLDLLQRWYGHHGYSFG